MDITREMFIDAIKKHPFYVRPCSLCGYEMSYCFRGKQLGFDSGCDCVSYDGWHPVEDYDLDFYLDPAHGHMDRIREFIANA
jgi:hypothetical protein